MSSDDAIITDIDETSLSLIKSLRFSLELIRKECDEIIKKIDENGIDAYYSVNSNIKSHCLKSNKDCAELYYLRSWKSKILKIRKNYEEGKNSKDREDEVGGKGGKG